MCKLSHFSPHVKEEGIEGGFKMCKFPQFSESIFELVKGIEARWHKNNQGFYISVHS